MWSFANESKDSSTQAHRLIDISGKLTRTASIQVNISSLETKQLLQFAPSYVNSLTQPERYFT